MVLLHGWPYDIHCYADVAPSLSAVGYRVIVPHLFGHGESDKPPGDYSLSAHAATWHQRKLSFMFGQELLPV